jgi:hypothetical protein
MTNLRHFGCWLGLLSGMGAVSHDVLAQRVSDLMTPQQTEGRSFFSSGNHRMKGMIVRALDGNVQHERFDSNDAWVRALRQKLGTNGGVRGEASLVRMWRTPGCGRVKVTLTFEKAVMDPSKGALQDVPVILELNVCKDGNPPTDSLDLREINQMMAQQGARGGPNQTIVQRPIPIIVNPGDKSGSR